MESTGRHLNNTQISDEDRDANWKVESILVKLRYRFSIASENASYPGYTSEKNLSSFQGHSIPIYWGNPDIKNECNLDAFINVHDFTDLDELKEYVARIDSDEEKWCEIAVQPWFTEQQLIKASEDMKKYRQFISDILRKDKQWMKRRPEGYWPDIYNSWIFDRSNMRDIPLLGQT